MQIITRINRLTTQVGQAVRWLSLLMVLATCLVVFLRYVTNTPSIALQESIMYCHAALFMLGSAYAWQQGSHVRVDILYRNWSAATQRRINRFGILVFVIPTCLFLLSVSWQYVANAWRIQETSPEASGLPFVYLLKTLILIMPALIIWQAIAEFFQPLNADQPETSHD